MGSQPVCWGLDKTQTDLERIRAVEDNDAMFGKHSTVTFGVLSCIALTMDLLGRYYSKSNQEETSTVKRLHYDL